MVIYSYFVLLYTIQLNVLQHCELSCRDFLYPGNWGNYRSWREQHVLQGLLVTYKRMRPIPLEYHGRNEQPPPVVIKISLSLDSINGVIERNMELKARFRFQQEWQDATLRFSDPYFRPIDYIHVPTNQTSQIWTPDTFFQNEKDGHYHELDQPNLSFLLHPDGNITYNRRVSMTFSCVMDFLKYPHDVQFCVMDFSSYAYTTADIVYEWHDKPLHISQDATSILPNFFIRSFNTGSCESFTNTDCIAFAVSNTKQMLITQTEQTHAHYNMIHTSGHRNYSCLRIELSLKRDVSFFFLQVYLPTTMLVSTAWLSFWIDWQATAGRFPLVTVTLLTMITQTNVINANLPPVSYAKAVDVWIGGCVMFIFASLIQYAVVNYVGIRAVKFVSGSSGPSVISEKRIWRTRSLIAGCSWRKFFSWMSRKTRTANEYFLQADLMLTSTIGPAKHKKSLRNRLWPRRRRPTTLWSSSWTPRIEYHFDISPQSVELRTALNFDINECRIPFEAGVFIEPEEPDNDNLSLRLPKKGRARFRKLYDSFKRCGRAERIDFVSRIVFPVAFLMFAIVYFGIYS